MAGLVHRSKSRSSAVAKPQPNTIARNTTGGITANVPNGAHFIQSNAESIRYTCGTKRFNNCIHSRVYKEYSKSADYYVHRTKGTPTAPLWTCEQDQGDVRSVTYTAHLLAEAAGRAALVNHYEFLTRRIYAAKAMSIMKPDLTKMSLPNFLLELKDASRLYTASKHIFKGARNLVFGQKQAGPKLNRKLSGHVLEYNFGLIPFAGDIKNIVSIVSSTFEAIKEWNNRVNLPQVRKCTVTPLTEQSASGSFNTSLGTGRTMITSWTATRKSLITGHCKFRPLPIKAMGNLERGLRAHLQAFGIQPNISHIWNAIPFTFVIDWVVNVGQWLDQFKIDVLELPFMLLDFCLQYETETKIVSTNLISDTSTWSDDVYPGWMTIDKQFQRVVCYPDPSDILPLGWKTPTLKQAFLGVNLMNALR